MPQRSLYLLMIVRSTMSQAFRKVGDRLADHRETISSMEPPSPFWEKAEDQHFV
jgi:hypothetical protein